MRSSREKERGEDMAEHNDIQNDEMIKKETQKSRNMETLVVLCLLVTIQTKKIIKGRYR